jgi:23S rRNA (adenine2503-C2)-methyltransferase
MFLSRRLWFPTAHTWRPIPSRTAPRPIHLATATQPARPDAALPNVYALSKHELGALVKSLGLAEYRAAQVWDWLYESSAVSYAEMKNLPKSTRELLQSATNIGELKVAREQKSADGTVKRLYRLRDGNTIETVLMPYNDGRYTICISSQAGCAMKCTFCATGQRGFSRQLTAAEIFEQVVLFRRDLQASGERVSNVVFMGMGEPLANLRNVMPAIERISSDLQIGFRHITVSTVGLVPQIATLARGPPVRLAVSLHAASDAERSRLMPVNQRYPLPALFAACREYIAATSSRVTFEYALIYGVNDTPDVAQRLAEALKAHDMPANKCHVNVIPLNPTGGFEGRATSAARMNVFMDVFSKACGIAITARVRRGIDIDAGCGQLAGAEAKMAGAEAKAVEVGVQKDRIMEARE